MVESARVGRRGAGPQRERGEGAPEVLQPFFEYGRGDKIDFVEDEDQPFCAAGGAEDFLFNGQGACGERVAGVEDVEEDVGGGENGFEGVGVGAVGGAGGIASG